MKNHGLHVISSPTNVSHGAGLSAPPAGMAPPKAAPRAPALYVSPWRAGSFFLGTDLFHAITHSDLSQLTPDMIEILKKAGVKKRDLNNRETASFAIGFISDELKRQAREEREQQQRMASVVVCSNCDEMYSGSPSCPRCSQGPITLERSTDSAPGTPGTLHLSSPAGASRRPVEISGPAPAAAAPAARAPAPRPMTRIANERSPRAKSVQPVTSLSRDLDDDKQGKKSAPTPIAPRPPARSASPPPGGGALPTPPSRKSEMSSLTVSADRPAPPAHIPGRRDDPGSALQAVGRGRGRGTGRGMVLHGSGEDFYTIGTPSPVAARRGDLLPEEQVEQQPPPPPPRDDMVLAMPPPSILPEHVVEVVKRRGSVALAENPRVSRVQGERRSTVSAPSGLAPVVAKRPLEQCPSCDEPNEPGYLYCGTCGAAKQGTAAAPTAAPSATSPRAMLPQLTSVMKSAPLSRKSASPTVSVPVPRPAVAPTPPSTPAPAPPVAPAAPSPPPPPPPPVDSVSKSPRGSPRPGGAADAAGDGGGVEAPSGDMFADILRGKALKPVNVEKLNKRLSHANAGQLANALAQALAKMRPSFEASEIEGNNDDDDDEW